MKKKILLFIYMVTFAVFSQQKQFDITWSDYKTISTGNYTIEVPSFDPEHFSYSLKDGLQFIAQWKIATSINENSVALNNVRYATISSTDLKGVDLKTIPNELTYTLRNSVARDKRFAYLIVSPIVKDANGTYKKVVSFIVNYNNNTNRSSIRSRREITNSVLNSGQWYKFYVDTTGVFRLSKNFLNRLGVNTNNIDPRNIKLYGNGGAMIPYSNAVQYPL